MEAVAGKEGCLMLLQSEVVPSSQGCSELRRWFGETVTPAGYAAQRQLHSSRLPGCHPIASSKLTPSIRCVGRESSLMSSMLLISF